MTGAIAGAVAGFGAGLAAGILVARWRDRSPRRGREFNAPTQSGSQEDDALVEQFGQRFGLTPEELTHLRALAQTIGAGSAVALIADPALFDRAVDACLVSQDGSRDSAEADALHTLRRKLLLDQAPIGAPLPSTHAIQPNQTVRLRFGEGSQARFLLGQVVEVDELGITLGLPATDRGRECLAVGAPVDAYLWEGHEAACAFSSQVLQVIPSALPLVVLAHSGQLTRFAAREYVHRPVTGTVRFRRMRAEEFRRFKAARTAPDVDTLPEGLGQMQEVSGADLRFATTVPLTVGDYLFLHIDCPELRPTEALAKVDLVQENGSERTVRARYVGIAAEARDALCRYAYQHAA